MLIQAVAWYWTAWAAHYAFFQFGHWRSYGTLLALPFKRLYIYFFDSNAWGDFFPPWVTLLLPLVILSSLAIARVAMTWRVAMMIGAAIVVCQWAAVMVHGVLIDHGGIFAAGWVYFALSPFVVFPSPLAAVVVTQIDLDKELMEA